MSDKKNISVQEKHASIVRGPMQVAFDITNKCNFKCLHCYNNSSENNRIPDELSDAQVIRFIKDLCTMKPLNVCICGGEPLLRFNLVCKVAKLLSSHDIQASMVTNGFLMTEEKAVALLKAGISRIQISVDGATSTSHEHMRQMPNSFERALNALRLLNKVGFTQVGVAFTPTSFNSKEVIDAYKICEEIGISEFRIQPLMILGRGKKNINEILATPMQYRNLVRDINYLISNKGMAKIQWGDPIDHLIRFKTVAQHLYAFLNVQSNGDIVPSPYLPISVGNIKRTSILKYWKKGLPKIWESPFIQQCAEQIKCVPDFAKEHTGQPIVWYDENIKIDLIKENKKLFA